MKGNYSEERASLGIRGKNHLRIHRLMCPSFLCVDYGQPRWLEYTSSLSNLLHDYAPNKGDIRQHLRYSRSTERYLSWAWGNSAAWGNLSAKYRRSARVHRSSIMHRKASQSTSELRPRSGWRKSHCCHHSTCRTHHTHPPLTCTGTGYHVPICSFSSRSE